MAVELGWNSKRKNEEFKLGTDFLRSMGLSEARVGKLTMEDVRQGKHKLHLEIDDEVLSRAVFTPEELTELKVKFFNEMDHDGDGKIDHRDLIKTMRKLGFADAQLDKVFDSLLVGFAGRK